MTPEAEALPSANQPELGVVVASTSPVIAAVQDLLSQLISIHIQP
ncbi:hypothetical protein FOXG_19788 [Fusarium oxysporum f. sp. lycopersici 4287]|uniref:Uncharacterized protein n=1 Tax=Fusarium oxysporum f. sp. lycopersici (strain 4287 / CBS 123668 / FGSC 9935 / NRRL 34936) TaxID=426428 RepID=A0A0J9V6W6_FUSO4|nr:hypothetical protein FOXG_19788 [Fusarium oxysporum f. sp. lycopersici 4287]KNB06925.1 hypothetical protein FOXG_19788 [Fusarium oxysporum f. sp. lycopersici 4287]